MRVARALRASGGRGLAGWDVPPFPRRDAPPTYFETTIADLGEFDADDATRFTSTRGVVPRSRVGVRVPSPNRPRKKAAWGIDLSDRSYDDPGRRYFVIVPQAMRAPALPAGSVFMSSAAAWITMAVPPFEKSEFGLEPRSTCSFVIVVFRAPLDSTVMFIMSPACGRPDSGGR